MKNLKIRSKDEVFTRYKKQMDIMLEKRNTKDQFLLGYMQGSKKTLEWVLGFIEED